MARPDWELGYNQGYAAGFEDGYEKGYREGAFLGFNNGVTTALTENEVQDPEHKLPRSLLVMNQAGLFRIVLAGPAAYEAAQKFEALGFIVEVLTL